MESEGGLMTMRRATLRTLTLVAVLLFGVGLWPGFPQPRVGPARGPEPALAAPTVRKVALIVGLNYYPNLPESQQLQGPINDAILLAQTLTTPKFGFQAKDVHLVVSPIPGTRLPQVNADVQVLPGQVSKAAIVSAFRKHMVADARPGDILVFAFMGHGSLWFDPRDPDRLARTLVPADSRDRSGASLDLLTVELANLVTEALARNPQNLTIILDSCYSGSRIRGRAATARGLSPDRRQAALASYRQVLRGARLGAQRPVALSADQSFFTSQRNYVLLAAAREDQVAYEETYEDNRVNGVFTRFLVESLRSSTTTSQTTYREVMERVAARVLGHRNGDQVPVLEGERDSVLFAGQVRDQRPFLSVERGRDPLDPNTVILRAGTAAGMTVGSVYDIYPANDFSFDNPRNRLGTIKVTQTKIDFSFARVTAGQAPPGAHAVERIHAQSVTLRVKLVAAKFSAAFVTALKNQVRASPFPLTFTEQSGYDVGIAPDPNRAGYVRVEQAGGEPLGGSFPLTDPQTAIKLAANVIKYARVRAVAAIDNPASGLRFTANWAPAEGTRSPGLRNGYPVLRAFSETEGDVIAFTVANKMPDPKNCPLYAAIVNIAADGAIIVVPEHTERGEEIRDQPWSNIRFRMVVPRGMTQFRRGREIFKIVVATTPINLRPLEQTGFLREGSPLAAGVPTRGLHERCAEDWAVKTFIFWLDQVRP